MDDPGICECNCLVNGHSLVCVRRREAIMYLRIRDHVVHLPVCWPCAQERQRSDPTRFVRAVPA